MKIVLVEINWLDAGLETIQLDDKGVKELTPMPRKSAGYLVVKNKERVVVSFGRIFDREHHSQLWDVCLVIPRGCITSIKELE